MMFFFPSEEAKAQRVFPIATGSNVYTVSPLKAIFV